MKRLILTSRLMPEFTKSDFADLAANFVFRFVWGPLPSPDELATYLGPVAPDHALGITGATEMRMLELIARGYSLTNALFHLRGLRQTRIFSEWEYGYLLMGLPMAATGRGGPRRGTAHARPRKFGPPAQGLLAKRSVAHRVRQGGSCP